MFKKMTLVLLALVVLTFASSAWAGGPTGCKKFNFVGSFVWTDLNEDVWGDQSVFHSYVFQLNVHADGTATQYWTGLPDFMMNGGTNSEWRGSWSCRADGKLVVTMIDGLYLPVNSAQNPNAVTPDIQLANHVRSTYLFSVDNDNTLTRVQARNRVYGPNDDPTDPAGGTLRPINTTTGTYKRLVASDADLLLP
jgi:hypothetical protein